MLAGTSITPLPAASQRCGARRGNGAAAAAAPPSRASPLLRPVPLRRSAAAARAASDGAPPKVVCLGEALYDHLADQKGRRREDVESWTPYPGGAPANVATALARLGVKVAFASALGRDEMGDKFLALLRERGVDTAGVQRTDAPTRDVYVTRALDGDREFAGFGRPSGEYCDTRIDAAKLPLAAIEAADVLVTGTLGLAAPQTRAAMLAAAKAAKAAGTKLFVDINWRPVFWPDPPAAAPVIADFLASADLVKISDADMAYLYGIDHKAALKDPAMVAAKLPAAAGVLVTAGDEGAAYCFRTAKGEHTGFVPVFKVDVADTTGAGDAFTAGFIAKMLEAGGLDRLAADPSALRAAVTFAAATGALTCAKPGAIAAQPARGEVDALVAAAAPAV